MLEEYLGVVTRKLYDDGMWKGLGAFYRGVAAGVFIGIGAAFSLVAKSDASLPPAISALLSGLCFSLGLWLVVTFRAELFTGDCMMISLGDCVSWRNVLRFLCLVLFGNLVGTALVALFLNISGAGDAIAETVTNMALAKEGVDPLQALASGVCCNFMVCCAVWLSIKTQRPIVVVPLVTAFVAYGLEHGVANMFYVTFAALLGTATNPFIGVGMVLIGNVMGALMLCLVAETCDGSRI